VIDLTDFEEIANARFEDAVTLAMYDRYDGAIYLCGFAVEIALKIRITKEHGLLSFPETKDEFRNFSVFKIKTHDLVKLRDLLQNNPLIISEHKWRFDLLSKHWDVNYRYRKLSGVTNKLLCFELIEAVEHLLKVIL
jgi:hypothetical protein